MLCLYLILPSQTHHTILVQDLALPLFIMMGHPFTLDQLRRGAVLYGGGTQFTETPTSGI